MYSRVMVSAAVLALVLVGGGCVKKAEKPGEKDGTATEAPKGTVDEAVEQLLDELEEEEDVVDETSDAGDISADEGAVMDIVNEEAYE